MPVANADANWKKGLGSLGVITLGSLGVIALRLMTNDLRHGLVLIARFGGHLCSELRDLLVEFEVLGSFPKIYQLPFTIWLTTCNSIGRVPFPAQL